MRYLPLILCSIAMIGGCCALLVWGAHPPAWLAGLEAALLAVSALVYGFTAYLPALPRWVFLRPVKGAFLVTLGIGAMYVPPQLIFSAFLIGWGVRLVWESTHEAIGGQPVRVQLARGSGELARREQSIRLHERGGLDVRG